MSIRRHSNFVFCHEKNGKYTNEKSFHITMDEVLQIFALFGVCSFGVFRILAFRFSPTTSLYTILLLSNGIMSLVQGIVQTILILEGLKKHFIHGVDKKKKKGREQVTFLIIVNISLWLLYSLTRNKYANLLYKDTLSEIIYHPEYLVDDQQTFNKVLFSNEINSGKLISRQEITKAIQNIERLSDSMNGNANAQAVKWIIINTITYPLLLYYHFHSSCCLSNMWKNCYS